MRKHSRIFIRNFAKTGWNLSTAPLLACAQTCIPFDMKPPKIHPKGPSGMGRAWHSNNGSRWFFLKTKHHMSRWIFGSRVFLCSQRGFVGVAPFGLVPCTFVNLQPRGGGLRSRAIVLSFSCIIYNLVRMVYKRYHGRPLTTPHS